MKQIINSIILSFTLLSAGLMLMSCPEEIDDSIATIARDDFPPTITIITPREQGVYRSDLVVTGTIIDTVDATGEKFGTVASGSTSWEILNKSTYTGTITLNDQGGFSFTIDTSALG